MQALLALLAHSALSASAGTPPTLSAIYVYQDLQPGFRMEATLKSTRPCPEGKFPSLVSEEWTKNVTARSERKGKTMTLRDRNILVRNECEGKRSPSKLTFEVKNESKQYDHVHLTLLDGLAVETVEHVEMKAHP